MSIQEWIEEKEKENVKRNVIVMVFRPFIKWLDRNLESIVTEGLKQVCKAYYNVKVNRCFYVYDVKNLQVLTAYIYMQG